MSNSLSNSDYLDLIWAVKRSTRHGGMITICDKLEELLTAGGSEDVPVPTPVEPAKPTAPAKFDKKAYQREYMKRKRGK